MVDYRDFYRELRTDWLKLRGQVFDAHTQLPALPAVIEDVRCRLEAGERMGLIYLDPGSCDRLEPACGWQAYDRLIQSIGSALRDYGVAHLGERDKVALAAVRSAEFVVFVGLSGGGEPAAALEKLRAALVERVRDAIVDWQGEHHLAPLESTAFELEIEPRIRIERSIYRSLHRARERCWRAGEERCSGHLTELRRMLAERDIVVRFQPIVDLQDGAVYAVEALSGAPSGEIFENPEMLFSFAEKSAEIVELERLCRGQATRLAGPLLGAGGPLAGGKLFFNCSAHAFDDAGLVAELAREAVAAGLEPSDLVVEVTERVAVTEWKTFRRRLMELRLAGLAVAVDDVGSGYSSLQVVAETEPDYLKLDASLVRDVHLSPIKRDLLETLAVMATKIGAESIAEGIETQEEFEVVRDIGVGYGQGYLFARPALPSKVGKVHFPAG